LLVLLLLARIAAGWQVIGTNLLHCLLLLLATASLCGLNQFVEVWVRHDIIFSIKYLLQHLLQHSTVIAAHVLQDVSCKSRAAWQAKRSKTGCCRCTVHAAC
jgi:hypothetical protein